VRICPQCETRTDDPVCPMDGFRTVDLSHLGPAADPLVGAIFEERYRIEELIGRGGYGAVYRATQLGMERPVAIKVLKAEFVGDLKEVARFQLEARAIANLRHPGIVLVHDFGVAQGGRLYLVMEYLQGRTLSSILETDAPLDPARALDLVCQAADALAEAHRAGIVHRDLKPDNLFVIPDRRRGELVKLLDFGVAKLMGPVERVGALTQTGVAIGSPRYMSPEQCQSYPVTPQSDLYSLGCILYEALTGGPVFHADSVTALMVAQVRQPPPPPTRAGVVLSGPLVDLTLRCLAKSPADRPQNAETLVAALTRIAADTNPGHAPPSAPHTPAAPTPRPDRAWTTDGPTGLAPAPPSTYALDLGGQGAPPSDSSAAAAAAASTRRKRALAAAATRPGAQSRLASFSKHAPTPRAAGRLRTAVLAVAALAALAAAAWLGVRLLRPADRLDPAHAAAAEALLRRGRDSIIAADRAERIRLRWVEFPAASYRMGVSAGDPDAQPAHPVDLAAFALTRTEITASQYAACVDEHACTAPLAAERADLRTGCTWGAASAADAPANCLTWPQAAAFCRWVGGHLPSEAQWEYAARSGGRDIAHPWGDADADCTRAHMHGGVSAGCGAGKPGPVCTKRDGDSAQGLCDLAGNVAEWTADWYVADWYENAPKDGSGPETGAARAIRGGGFRQSANNLRATARAGVSPDLATDLIGFRCAR
jgi:serine/threonine protein kinase/formylglycine-generating enzyme required for sulfatase activity